MGIWVARDGAKYGPYTIEQLEQWLAEGKVSQHDLAWSQGRQWRPLRDLLRDAGCNIPPPPPQAASLFQDVGASSNPDATIQRIASYERFSGIAWIVIGAFQCIAVVSIIAGIWNIFAGISAIKSVPLILSRDSRVPAMYEGVGQLIIIGLINLFLGGGIGILFVIFDFIIRNMVLKNRHLFEHSTSTAKLSKGEI